MKRRRSTDLPPLRYLTFPGSPRSSHSRRPLAISRMITEESDGRKEYAVAGGLLYFENDLATILTDAIESKEEIDLRRAEEAKQRTVAPSAGSPRPAEFPHSQETPQRRPTPFRCRRPRPAPQTPRLPIASEGETPRRFPMEAVPDPPPPAPATPRHPTVPKRLLGRPSGDCATERTAHSPHWPQAAPHEPHPVRTAGWSLWQPCVGCAYPTPPPPSRSRRYPHG